MRYRIKEFDITYMIVYYSCSVIYIVELYLEYDIQNKLNLIITKV